MEDEDTLTPAEVSTRLVDLLGAKLVAYVGSTSETRTVQQWSSGEREPTDDVNLRLRAAHRAASLLREKEAATVVQAWFQGMNRRLDDVAPARLLREGDIAEAGPAVLAAARAFAGQG